MITVSCEVLCGYIEVMICVQFPELAVYYIKMFVREIICYFINIILFLKLYENIQKITDIKITEYNLTLPCTINRVKDTTDNLRERAIVIQ